MSDPIAPPSQGFAYPHLMLNPLEMGSRTTGDLRSIVDQFLEKGRRLGCDVAVEIHHNHDPLIEAWMRPLRAKDV